jgi:hypothetical protein
LACGAQLALRLSVVIHAALNSEAGQAGFQQQSRFSARHSRESGNPVSLLSLVDLKQRLPLACGERVTFSSTAKKK